VNQFQHFVCLCIESCATQQITVFEATMLQTGVSQLSLAAKFVVLPIKITAIGFGSINALVDKTVFFIAHADSW
jgi:hypothetical protein